MRLALLPTNPTIGDLGGNAQRLAEEAGRAVEAGARVVVAPELAICGYPPRDLLLQEGFVEACLERVGWLAQRVPGATLLVGCPARPQRDPTSGAVVNALLALRDGAIVARHDKRLLPTYDVFDEDRYFTPGDRAVVVEAPPRRLGLTLCEDLWRGADAGALERYAGRPDPVEEIARAGADLVVNPSASPFVLGKSRLQQSILERHCAQRAAAFAAVNQHGGNDDLVFDGRASIYVPDGASPAGARLVATNAPFTGDAVIFDLPDDRRAWATLPKAPEPLDGAPDEELLFRALTLGVRDYVRKTGFASAVLGLSGGIDSAVTACVAAAALGPAGVLTISMPSRYSSEGSVADAAALARSLGVRLVSAPIGRAHDACRETLAPAMGVLGFGVDSDVTDENMQSRLRGLIVMAFSNKVGALPLTTGNKSELAVGYCTLYGDMNGGLAVLSDVTKAWVYRLARWINANPARAGFASAPIPEASITKPPSAELRPDQTDQDTLPPYDVVDEIVARSIERKQSPARIARETGFEPATVARIVRMIDLAEFKRKQAAVGIKVTGVAFGSGRRYPIAQGWRPERGLS